MPIKFNSKLFLLFVLTLSLTLLPSHCNQQVEEESAQGKLFECFTKCSRQRHNQGELSHCEESCVRQYQERKKQEREEGSAGGGRGRDGGENHHGDPVQQYQQCQSRCGRQEYGEKKQYCLQQCRWEFEKQKKEHSQHGGEDVNRKEKEWKEEDEEGKQESNNPYYFKSQRFDSKYRTQEGHIKVLERFSKKSELLQGIENYRLEILEANPNTFLLPHHCDAESILVVVGGNGTISYVWNNQRKTHNLKHGDVMRVPAGSVLYLVNQDDNERLNVLKFLQPVNTPGLFKDYFGVGGGNPESYYRTFSNELLLAALKTQRVKLERLFRQQGKGVIIKASKEQIRALSQKSESSIWGTRGQEESWGTPFNLLNLSPLFSNEFGQYIEASPNDHQQLKDLDVSVGFMIINKGGMIAPYYNSRSTKLVFVMGGSGQFEMACPHLAAATNKQGSHGKKETTTDVHYQKVTARLSAGDAFVIPAGHPIAIVASQDSDLQLAGFGIKGSYNQKYFLAGQENIWNQVQPEAKELAFQVPAREVDEIFRSQEQSYFVAGPGQREEGKGEHSMASILDFVGF